MKQAGWFKPGRNIDSIKSTSISFKNRKALYNQSEDHARGSVSGGAGRKRVARVYGGER